MQALPDPAEIAGDHDRTAGDVPDLVDDDSVLDGGTRVEREVRVVIGREHALEHADVDVLAAPGARAHQQRREQADRAVQRRDRIGDREAQIGRARAVELRLAREQAALGVHDRGVRRPARVGTGLAEAAHRQHAQPRIARGQRA